MFDFFFFFKQKTAYEMRISDWSSDVCSSDLAGSVAVAGGDGTGGRVHQAHQPAVENIPIGIGVGGHGDDAHGGAVHRRLLLHPGHQASIPIGFYTSSFKTSIRRPPSAPSVARVLKLTVAVMTVATRDASDIDGTRLV